MRNEQNETQSMKKIVSFRYTSFWQLAYVGYSGRFLHILMEDLRSLRQALIYTFGMPIKC